MGQPGQGEGPGMAGWSGVRGGAFLGRRGRVAGHGRPGVTAKRQPGLPRPAGTRAVPGDMMMDWASPAGGGRGRSVFGGRPRALRGRAGSGLTAVWRELAAVIPIG
jgi:hypothetical protein